MPVSSALLVPAVNEVVVHDGFIDCSGWAFSGSAFVQRVEVSSDGGFVWFEVPEENLSPKYYHAARLWHMKLPVQAEGWLELVVRCWGESHSPSSSTLH
jgi:sulfite oxidase